MSYDDEVRLGTHKGIWENCIRPADNEWTTWTDAIVLNEAALNAIPDATLKIDGRFVRVEIASGTNYTSKTHYTPLYRIVDDSDA